MARALLFALAVTAVATPAFAQELLFGGGLTLGSSIKEPGLQAHAYYAFGNKIPRLRLGGDIDAFLPNTDKSSLGEAKVTWFDLNVNAQYVFFAPKDSPFNAYGLGGLNLAVVGSSFDYNDNMAQRDTSAHSTRLGVNLGAGAEYMLPFAAAFFELKYVASDAHQWVGTAGLRFAYPLSKTEQKAPPKDQAED